MTSYFQILSIPQSFSVDLPTLESAYFKAQRQFHPDKVARLDAKAQLEATQQSIRINDAYHTLKNPLKRAKYLLSLYGIEVLDEANKAKANPALLMEIMELQEQLMEGKSPELLADIQQRIFETEQALEAQFKKSDFDSAKDSTIRLSYLYKLAQ